MHASTMRRMAGLLSGLTAVTYGRRGRMEDIRWPAATPVQKPGASLANPEMRCCKIASVISGNLTVPPLFSPKKVGDEAKRMALSG